MPSIARRLLAAAVIAIAAGVLGQSATAQPAPLVQRVVPLAIDSGPVQNNGPARAVIYSTVVKADHSAWIRLKFDEATLGRTPAGGQSTIVRMTSALDGGVQYMKAVHLRQWQNTSAYFNGDTVLIEIVADPGAPPSRLVINMVWAGELVDVVQGGIASICGADDRVLSDDPRAARILPVGCTGWIIDDVAHCMLTAGHCAGGTDTIEFNVPLSSPSGALNHPGPEDQYAADQSSIQSTNGGIGNDWCYYGCFPNSNTNLTPFEAQQASYVLADAAPSPSGQNIRITGYGVDDSPPQNNQV